MATSRQLREQIAAGRWDAALAALYGGSEKVLARQRSRYGAALEQFELYYGPGRQVQVYSAPGRTELGGNHTDHQHGRVLCGSVDLDMLACAAPNGTDLVRIRSEGYPALEVDLRDLKVREEEKNSSPALVRGVAARLVELGCRPAGFDAYVTSTVLSGSGLSSSAAYEILVATIVDCFFGGGTLDPVERAKVGQYAENVYFGKPCGLMDQMGSSVGGAVAIDFADPAAPVVKKVEYDFTRSGHALCIVDTGSCHADLTDDYADITREMGAVAARFGEKFLRDVDEGAFRAALPQLREECGDRAVLRAMHFFEEDRRAEQEAEALEQGDFDAFLALVDQSGLSSALNLQNTWSAAAPQQQAIPVALAVGRELLGGSGAIRVHGGGFAGTIQAFVPNGKLETFRRGMEELLGPGMCHILHIRPHGGCVVLK